MFKIKSILLFLSILCLSANLYANESIKESVTDSAITTKVKASLLADADVSSLSISVETQKAMVTLSGCADTQAQIDKAEKDTKEISGVKSVTNNLKICNKE